MLWEDVGNWELNTRSVQNVDACILRHPMTVHPVITVREVIDGRTDEV